MTDYEKELLDLRETNRLLMAENEMLAERAEDTLLLSLIAEQINLLTDPGRILESTLEQIGLLKNLSACMVGMLKDARVIIRAAYLTFSERAFCGIELPLDPELADQFLDGAGIFSATDPSASSLFAQLAQYGVTSETLLIIPFEDQASGSGIFAFAVDQADERLPDMVMMLNRVVEMVVDRCNNLYLIQALNRTNLQLQAAVSELEAFSYSVSHDLRAPLRVINGYASILIESFDAQIPAEASDYLTRIQESALRMGSLIDNLLEFSRLGRKPLESLPVNLKALVEQVWADIAPEYAGRDVALVLGDLPECQGDPHLLRQVLANLLSNAVKFTRTRPNARIEVGYSTALGETHGVKGAYFIRDNGVGFDMQYADKLFGVFQRLHRESEYEGTGVGLAICQRILLRHGGKIWAEAVVDQGAAFYFFVNP